MKNGPSRTPVPTVSYSILFSRIQIITISLCFKRTASDLFLNLVGTGVLVKATFGLSYALALIFGGQAVIEGTLDTGTLVTFLGLLLLVQNPVVQLGDIINRVQRGLASYKRLKSIDDEISIPESEFEETDEESVVEGKDITVKNLTFTYPDGEKPALNNISFTIKSGSTIGIAGATGHPNRLHPHCLSEEKP